MYLHDITFNSWYVFNVTFKMNCRLVRLFSMSGTIENSLAGNKLNTQLSENIQLKLKKKKTTKNIITKTQIAYLWEFLRNLKIRRFFFFIFWFVFNAFQFSSQAFNLQPWRHCLCKSTLASNRVKKMFVIFFYLFVFLLVCRI